MKIITAFATDDGKSFIKRHFGDAYYYDIYEISASEAKFIKRIKNTTDEDQDIHADTKKAKGVTVLLKNENVKVVVSKIYGPNIKRIRKIFVCILMNNKKISYSTKTIRKNIDIIINEWEKGESRSYINLKYK
jgi:predicted Fe-Mo cluster-binding NifX family protein